MPDEEARWSHSEFCRKNKGLQLFLQDWWLDLFCIGDWGAATAEKRGRCNARELCDL